MKPITFIAIAATVMIATSASFAQSPPPKKPVQRTAKPAPATSDSTAPAAASSDDSTKQPGIGDQIQSAITKRIIETPISDAPSYAKYALVIGVTDYQAAAQLTVCGQDAARFATMLKTRFGFQNVVLMTDNPGTPPMLRPTQRNIEDALDNMYGSIIPGKSEVVFFYSGHGTRAPDSSGADADWLVPEDGRPNRVSLTCINYDSIRRTLDTKSPKRALIISDACRDLLNGKGVGSSNFGGRFNQVFGAEVAELQSCQPKETSLEGDPRDFKESVFTHYLIRGMSGDPDAIDPDKHSVTFDSLKQYVQFSVRAYAAKLNSVQTPDGRASLGSMVIAKGGGSPPPADVASQDTSPQLGSAPPMRTDTAPSATTGPATTTPPPHRVFGANTAFKKAIAKMIADDASYEEMTKQVKQLIADGADINCKDSSGYPAIVSAAYKDKGYLVEVLIENGAKVNLATDAPGAEGSGDGDNVSIVPTAELPQVKVDTSGASIGTFDPSVLFKAKAKKKPEVVSGVTALMCAARVGDSDIIDFLLKNGADKSIRDNQGKTALDYAKDAKMADCIEALKK